MNIFDILVILIITGFAISSYRSGFIRTCFGFVPMFLSLFCAYKVTPVLSKFIRGTGFYTDYKQKIASYLQLDSLVSSGIQNSQTELINSMNLPGFLKESLIENNNSVVYKILDVSEIQDYISGYIANVSINIISILLVFIVTFLLAKTLLYTFNILASLPVLNFINGIGGLSVGIIKGVVVVWIMFIGLTFFYCNPQFKSVFEMLNQSKFAGVLYENNWLLFLILKIFA